MANFFVRSRPTATRTASHAYSLGDKIVSTSSTQFLGICFECTTAGTSGGGGEPAWNTTIGGTTTDGGVTWTTRGAAGIWLASKAYALGDRVCKVSQTSKNNANSPVWECTTAGTSGGTEPTWPTTITAGTTTQTDGGVTWTARACTTWDNANPFIGALIQDTSNSTIKVSAGDTVYVAGSHAEAWTPSGIHDHNFPGTATNPNRVLCVDDTGQSSSPTTLLTSATVTLNAGGSGIQLSITGAAYIYGITWKNLTTSGTSNLGCFTNNAMTAASLVSVKMEQCGLTLGNNSGTCQFSFGTTTGSANDQVVELVNCTLTYANVNSLMLFGACRFTMKGGSIAGTSVTQMITPNTGTGSSGTVEFDGVDLSSQTGKLNSGTGGGSQTIIFRNCKLGVGATVGATSGSGWNYPIFDIINCDSGGTNYKVHREHGLGTIDQETTKIRSSGASDGTTGISWKAVSNSAALWQFPLPMFEIAIWNDNSGSSKTATVEILADSATNLNNDDIWMEVEYLGDASSPKSSMVSNTKSNILASNAALSSSSASWTTTGMTNPNAMKLQASFTPQQKGPVTCRVYLGKPSQTVYIDPMVTIT